jgi:predicted membrane channel-forming protein YqfA (hemolysin III family)
MVFYISFFGIFMILSMGFPYFSTMIRKNVFETLRTMIFLGIVIFGFVPLLHTFAIENYVFLYYDKRKFILIGVLLMSIFYGIGMFFWISKIPEKYKPGYFDIWGQSHTIWHIFVIIASSSWYFCMMETFYLKIKP